MEKFCSHKPFGHQIEAFSKNIPPRQADAEALTRESASFLDVPCACGCGGHSHRDDVSHGHGRPWKKLTVAGLLAVLAEGGHFAAVGASPEHVFLLEALAFICSLSAIALSGLETYREGWRSVCRRELNMAALMSVAVTGAVLIGQFPEAAMVMVLFNVSHAIEEGIKARARRSIRNVLAISPERATVRQPDGSWLEQDCRLVPIGATVRVRPGERIALDGVVCEGHSAVDQSPVTGESIPVEKCAGDTVFAGTLNTLGSFEFKVTAAASDTTLARIIRAVEQVQSSRAPIQRLVDSFARWYTPCILVSSLLLALLPPLLLGAEWTASIYTALVMLVIGCPCALVISTPVTIVGAVAAAARIGLVVKGGAVLEQGRRLRVLALDKTGTLTQGRPRLMEVVPIHGSSSEVLALASALAAHSEHPVSRAIAEAAAEPVQSVQDFKAVPGMGVQGRRCGRFLKLGSVRMLEKEGLFSGEKGEVLLRLVHDLEAMGCSVAVLADEKNILALFAVSDSLRESSVQAVRELTELGVKTVMLSGDNEASARTIARQLGVDEFRAQLLPEDKQTCMEDLIAASRETEHRGVVGMAGDGINDAPALAQADIGFAMAGTGTDTAMEVADVILMDDDLRKIPRFIRLSRGMFDILLQNIVLALGIKLLFFGLTLVGCTTMWMAVFADVGAALLVVGNGLRAARLTGAPR